jgi:hypothetical protein
VDDLLQAVQKLTNSKFHAKWQSFSHAFSAILGEPGMVLLTQKITQAQQNVTLVLVLLEK